MSISVIGNCRPVKSYCKNLLFGNALQPVGPSVFVSRWHCVSAAGGSVAGRQPVAFRLRGARTGLHARGWPGCSGGVVEMVVGSNDVFWSVPILKKNNFSCLNEGVACERVAVKSALQEIRASVADCCGWSWERGTLLGARLLRGFLRVNNLCRTGHPSRFERSGWQQPLLWRALRMWEEQFSRMYWLQSLLCCFLCNILLSDANKLEVVGRGS